MPQIELPDVLKNAPGMRAAELVVDGLSVFCFNQIEAEKFWEVAYPRKEHDLKIKIQELNGAGNPVGAPMTHAVHPDVETFTIRLTNGSLEHYEPKHFPNGGPRAEVFNRDPAVDDPHDLQWMIDLAGIHVGHGQVLELKPRPGHPRALANIRHSLFCNLEPEQSPARISPQHDNHPGARGSFDLGPTNTFIVGVMLATEDGDIEFDFQPPLTMIGSLPYDENKRYRIEIKNEDNLDPVTEDGFVRGDLRMFYDELIIVSGQKKDHWAKPDPLRFSPDGDCHPTLFSGATLGP